MGDWIPLLQSLLWPAVVVGGVIWLRPTIKRILSAVARRIEEGDSFEAGASGVKLGSGRTQTTELLEGGRVGAEGPWPQSVYLIHSKRRAVDLDKSNKEYYRLRVWLDADSEAILDKIESVTYHLHPTFRDPVRIVEDRSTRFALQTAAWGEFNMYAEIRFKNGGDTTRVERYIDL